MKSDPYGELPERKEKYAAQCAQLHMGRKGITELVGFEKFVNLHTLWLNNNHLHSLEGLDCNIRLLNLHCHGNRISRISGTLQTLKFLVTLTLNENCLNDIEDVISELQHLKNVQYLDLFDNPITQEDNYRYRVIAELPWVQTLDKHEVTDEERKVAKKVLKKILRSKNILNATRRDTEAEEIKKEIVPELPSHVVDSIRRRISSSRCFLESELLKFDPQKLGRVLETDFKAVCNHFGLFDALSEDEISHIVRLYTDHHHHHNRSPIKTHTAASLTLSASSGSIYKVFISYPDFCRLVARNPLRTMRFDEWKMEPVPELSVSTADLKRYVQNVERKRHQQIELEKRKTLLSASQNFGGSGAAGMSAAFNQSGASVSARSTTAPGSMRMTGTVQIKQDGGSTAVGTQGLDAWHSSALRNIVKSIAKQAGVTVSGAAAGTPVPTINAEESFETVVTEMKQYGKIPTSSRSNSVRNLLSVASADGKIDVNVFCDVVGCAPVFYYKKVATGAPTNASVPAISVPSSSIVRLTWCEAPLNLKETVEKGKFQESEMLLDALLRSGRGSDTKELAAKTIKAATVGTRLMSTRETHPKPPVVLTPAQIVAAAPDRRADVVLLPRLLKKQPEEDSSTLSGVDAAASLSQTDPFKAVEDEWRAQLMALGLKGHDLVFAMDRKKRSFAKTSGDEVPNVRKTYVPGQYSERKPKPGEFVSAGHKNAWNATTGTFIICNEKNK
jgi:hypothetical protein